jgi:hypothetical protein
VFLEIFYLFIVKNPECHATMIDQGSVTALIGFLEKYPSLMDVKVQQIITDMLIDLDNKVLLKLFLKNFLLNIDLISKTNNSFKAFISHTATVLYKKRKWLSELFPIDWIVKSLILYFYAAEAKSKPVCESAEKPKYIKDPTSPQLDSSMREESLFTPDTSEFQSIIKESSQLAAHSIDHTSVKPISPALNSKDEGDSARHREESPEKSSRESQFDGISPIEAQQSRGGDTEAGELYDSGHVFELNIKKLEPRDDVRDSGTHEQQTSPGQQPFKDHLGAPGQPIAEQDKMAADINKQEKEGSGFSLVPVDPDVSQSWSNQGDRSLPHKIFQGDESDMLSQLDILKENSADKEDLQFLTSNIDYLVTLIENLLAEKDTQLDHLQRNTNFILTSLCFPNIPYPLQRYLLRICRILIDQLKAIDVPKAQEIVTNSNAIFSLIDLFKTTRCYKTKAEILPLLEDLAAINNSGLKRVAQILSIFSSFKIESVEEYAGEDIEADLELYFGAVMTLVTKYMRQLDNDRRSNESLSSKVEEERRATNTAFLECLLNLYSHLNFSMKSMLIHNISQLMNSQSSPISEIFSK